MWYTVKEGVTEPMHKIEVPNHHFRIDQICGSGQCFRLDRVEDRIYEVIAGEKYLKIKQYPDKTSFYCTEKEYTCFWKMYFDLDVCYETYIESIDKGDTYLSKAAAFGEGIRILRQDVWEMIVSFILSQQNNIPRIKQLIRILCEQCGEERRSPEGRVYYTFPTAERLSEVEESTFREWKLGYRSRYLQETARAVAEGKVRLSDLSGMEYETAKKELMKLCGIGAKVADCICLFALHKLDAFPVDTHIQKVLEREYKKGFPFERYRGYAGVMQQYIFYYDLKNGVAMKEM
nr:DNA glycosylase [Mediterraneibacter massiliensis]